MFLRTFPLPDGDMTIESPTRFVRVELPIVRFDQIVGLIPEVQFPGYHLFRPTIILDTIGEIHKIELHRHPAVHIYTTNADTAVSVLRKISLIHAGYTG